MAKGPFKMKGYSYPGAAPAKKKEGREVVKSYASGEKEVIVDSDKRSSAELISLSEQARKDGNIKAANEMLAKAKKKKSEQKRAQDYLDTNA